MAVHLKALVGLGLEGPDLGLGLKILAGNSDMNDLITHINLRYKLFHNSHLCHSTVDDG